MLQSSAIRVFSHIRADRIQGLFCAARSQRFQRLLLWITLSAILATLAAGEFRSSWLQSRIFTAAAKRATFRLGSGPSDAVRYPRTGPYDLRLGYSRIPEFIGRAQAVGYRIREQVLDSNLYLALTSMGVYPIYREKNRAGLRIVDRGGLSLYEFRYPEAVYREYSEIPKLVTDTLLFIENRQILDPLHPHRNPAIEWPRLFHAVVDNLIHAINPRYPAFGGSTLATQLEKIRHSPNGRTQSAPEKLRQMLSASLRAYQEGPRTIEPRQRIIRDYLNSLPLASAPGYGEILGLGDGLKLWYGADFDQVNRLLRENGHADDAEQRAQARAYRQVLALLLATRAPYRNLVHNPGELKDQTDRYLRVLNKEGVISANLRDLALQEYTPAQPHSSVNRADFVNNKARDQVRNTVLSVLGVERTYTLDRFDLTVYTTIDGPAQQEVTAFLRGITDPTRIDAAKLRAPRLLARGDPRSVIYSFTLYERGPGLNLLRVQADNLNQPLSINEGTKLELGSTAKLRTLTTYLQIIEQLHAKYAHQPAKDLRRGPADNDPLTMWAVAYLSTSTNGDLQAMLQAALDRRYSASPAEGFFTGGGLHHFSNFESADNGRIVTVREAFEHSINLAFIRLMRDIERYYVHRLRSEAGSALADIDHAARQQYLVRFADQEGRVFLTRFYRKYQGLSPEEALETLVNPISSPRRLTVIYRYVRPEASFDEFVAFLRKHGTREPLQQQKLPVLYEKYGPGKFNLADCGYLAHVHPLELWLLRYMQEHAARPDIMLAEIIRASAEERQQSYAWLFRTRHTGAQDKRIRILIEEEAFREIWRAWKKTGYPFDRLVPSYATAIGTSGDTPAALADLMGIILNDGVRYPSVAVPRLHFGEGTPMEALLERQSGEGERVFSRDIAALVRHELMMVVERGTAQRARGGVRLRDGTVLALGGKTGTGDNRMKTMVSAGRLRDSRVVNRTAAFAFILGDRFFGTVTVLVPGKDAGAYAFTSSLAVQVFMDLEPALTSVFSSLNSDETTPPRGQ